MSSPYEFTKERVLDAIKSSFGIMSRIAKNLDGCEWHTAEKYVNRWAETRQAFADEDERALDLSESKMIEQIAAGDGPMIRFHLATKGKRRGYTERTELSGPEGGPIEHNVKPDLSQLSDQELSALAAIAERLVGDAAGTGAPAL